LPTVLGEKVVLRILDQSSTKVALHELGFAGSLLEIWESLITKPYGMILVTGPTGSGKTTTLYTSLSRINTPERNIVSVENPVEYQIPRVNQVQVNVKVGLTFASGLRTILRQDPDVVLIGEIRDRETAEIAVQASMTGYKGRLGVFELMVITDPIQGLAVSGAPTEKLRELAIAEGMRTLRQDAVSKVLEGVTTFEEMLRVVFVSESV